MRQRSVVIALLVLGLVVFTRLPGLTSGLNILEGDEWLYQNIAQTLTHSPGPLYQGTIFLQRHPSFLVLGYLIGRIFPWTVTVGPYVNLRLISVAADLIFTLCLLRIYRQLRINSLITLVGMILVTFVPLHWFFARQGTYEMFLTAFAVLFLTVFLDWKEKPIKGRAILTGLTLALALAAKFTNVLLLAVFIPDITEISWRKNSRQWLLLGGFAVSGFAFLVSPMVLVNPPEFVRQFFFGFYGLYWPFHLRTFLAIWQEYGRFLPMWYSWPVLAWSVAGIIFAVKNRTKQLYSFLAALAVATIYLGLYYLNDRIAIILLPWTAVLTAFGLQGAVERLPRKFFWTLVSVSLLITVYQGSIAFRSTLHAARETALTQVLVFHKQYPDDKIYTTIDPSKTIGSLPGLNVQLLSPEATGGGIILTDEQSSPVILNLTEKPYVQAKQTLEAIRREYQPRDTLADPLPHFPWNLSGNKFHIFILPRK